MASNHQDRVKTFIPSNKAIYIILIALLVILLGVLIAVPPLVMADMIRGPVSFARLYQAKDFGLETQQVSLTTSDGLQIVTYEVPTPDPKAVVIFLSGIHNPSVTAFFGHAKLLQDHGYASLLVEMRAHDQSEGERIALGYKEYLDVQAAVDYIQSQSSYQGTPLVVYGLSMGGATAITAIGNLPQIDALVSLSAFSSWEDNFVENMVAMGMPATYGALQKPFVKLYTVLLYGWESFNNTPLDNIQKLGDRPALLIHSSGDSQVPIGNFERLVDQAPDHVETWVREGDLHLIVLEGMFLEPEMDTEYTQRVIGFLDRNFD
jgi:uncharacterized protein